MHVDVELGQRQSVETVPGHRAFKRHLARPLAAGILTAAAALIVYYLTAAPDLTWAYAGADGGELITAAVTLGVPHPPGYPLYILVGKLASYLPFEPVARRFNLLSALCMASSAAILALLTAALALRHKQGGPARALSAGLFAGATFAFLPLVWQQALIAEVYALNMVMVSALLYLTLRRPVGKHRELAVGILLGLALTTHLTSLFLIPIVLANLRPRTWTRFCLGTALGLTLFLLLPLLATTGSPVIWGEPQAASGWWWLVTAEIYHPNVLALPLARLPHRLLLWASESSLWIAATLLLLSLLCAHPVVHRHKKGAAAAVVTLALYLLYALGYDAPDSLVLTLPALGLVCAAAGFALASRAPWLLLLPVTLLVLNFSAIDLSERNDARTLSESTLREAPLDSIVLTSGDQATFTLWYLQHVEGQREDLVIIDGDLFAFDWYRERLATHHPGIAGLDRDDLPRLRRLNEKARPWCELRFNATGVETFWCAQESG